MEDILQKISRDQIDYFLSQTKEGHTDIIQNIQPLNDLEQLKIKEYLEINSELFIEINSKEQFLGILKSKERFDEYAPDKLYDSIFIFPFI